MITAPNGMQYELVGNKIRLHLPPGMTMAEAMMTIQPRIDAANAATGLDIQMVWAEEDPPSTVRKPKSRPPFDRPDSRTREDREEARREHLEAHG